MYNMLLCNFLLFNSTQLKKILTQVSINIQGKVGEKLKLCYFLHQFCTGFLSPQLVSYAIGIFLLAFALVSTLKFVFNPWLGTCGASRNDMLTFTQVVNVVDWSFSTVSMFCIISRRLNQILSPCEISRLPWRDFKVSLFLQLYFSSFSEYSLHSG